MRNFIIAALAAATIAAPAAANDRTWKVGNDSYHVYFDDIDTHSAVGRAKMLARVEAAAAKLCTDQIASDRRACVAASVRQIAMKSSPALQLALDERSAPRFAAR